MRVYVRGKKEVNLDRKNFVYQGGEGSIYRKNRVAYKIFKDAQKQFPEAKIEELRKISSQNVIRPKDILLDQKGVYVGYTMKWIANSVALARLFTSEFRNKNGIDNSRTLELVEAIKEVIYKIHQAGCLMVDGNEFNYLVDDQTFIVPYFIDVNSYQTPSFAPTVIMPSIRDWHSPTWSELTDWFSFGIVSCQLFTGIHPYKGKHPGYNRKKMGDDLLKNRMKDNVSIFNPEVSLPPATRDFDSLPSNYRQWFIDLFENGKRTPPPKEGGTVTTPANGKRIAYGTGHFTIEHLRSFSEPIVGYRKVFGVETVWTQNRIHIKNKTIPRSYDEEIVFTPFREIPVLAKIQNGHVRFFPADGSDVKIREIALQGNELMIVENTLYVKNQGNLLEFTFLDKKKEDIIPLVNAKWNVMPQSSRIFDGFIFQDVLGKPYIAILLPGKNGNSACVHLPIPELSGYRIIDGKHDQGVLAILAYTPDRYDRMVFKFDIHFRKYDIRIEQDVHPAEVNFVVLPNGIAVSITEENGVEIFSRDPERNRSDSIKDPEVDTSMRLCRDGVAVKFHRGKDLFALSMKKIAA